MREGRFGQWADFLFLPTHYLLVLALFFKSRDNLIAQKLGPHIGTIFSIDMMSCTEMESAPAPGREKVELIFPAELIASFTQCVVSYLCSGCPFARSAA